MEPDHEAESRLRMGRLFTATARQPGRGPGTAMRGNIDRAFARLASYDPPGVTPEQRRVLFLAFSAGYAAAIAEMEADAALK